MYQEKFSKVVNYLRSKKIYPELITIDGNSTNPEVIIDGKTVLLFCSYNYLGITNHPQIENAFIQGVKDYQIQPGGSRLISGTQNVHKKLEKTLAEFKHTDDSILFTNGMVTNMGVIPAIMNLPKFTLDFVIKNIFIKQESYILSDELNHASIVDGCRLSKANILIYKHKNLSDLEIKLKEIQKKWKLIVTDGVFSMDGDIAPLPGIIELANKYNALLMVDDAHGTGVLGHYGSGTLEHFNLNSGVDLQMGTLSKALGTLGGFISASQDIVDYLRISARTYVFSGALPAPLASAAIEAIDLAQKSIELRKKLWHNSDYFRDNLRDLGFNVFQSESPTPIIPLLIGDENKSRLVNKELLENGVFAPSIRWPAVPKNQARIRFTLMATHTKEQIDYLINLLKKLNTKYQFTH